MSKENETNPLKRPTVISSAFMQIPRWFEKMFCKHKNKTEIFRCYQDRYVSEVCNDCGKVIYSDL